MESLKPVLDVLSLTTCRASSINIFGAPIGNDDFIRGSLNAKLSQRKEALNSLEELPELLC